MVRDVGAYATAIAETAARMQDRVRAAAADADEARELLDELGATAAVLQAGQDGYPPVALASGAELLTTAALAPVVAAHASALGNGRRYREEQATANGQVERAAQLHATIGAGEAQGSARSAPSARCSPLASLPSTTELRTKTLLVPRPVTFALLPEWWRPRPPRGDAGLAHPIGFVVQFAGLAPSSRR